MREIDYDNWERRQAYEFFSGISHPFYAVSFRQDVTGLYRCAKQQGISFYESMIWACTQAVNSVSAFRVAMRGGRPVELDMRHPSFTDLRPGEEQFNIVTMKHNTDLSAFCEEASRLRRTQDTFLDESKETDDLIYYSCLPWIDLTAATNERDLSAPHALDDSIPRIIWGKYTAAGYWGSPWKSITVLSTDIISDGSHRTWNSVSTVWEGSENDQNN